MLFVLSGPLHKLTLTAPWLHGQVKSHISPVFQLCPLQSLRLHWNNVQTLCLANLLPTLHFSLASQTT